MKLMRHVRRRMTRSINLCFAAVMLAACGSGPVKPKPGPLEAIVTPVTGRLVWSQRVDAVQFPLEVSTQAGVFTVAGDDGTVLALDASTGRELWRGNVGAKLSSGVGSDGHLVAVVTRADDLVVMDGGRVLWKKPLGVRVATRPLVAGQRVFIQATDRSVHAFDGQAGDHLWTVRRPGDALTLNQSGVLVAVGNTLVVGQGSRLAGLNPLTGAVNWEVPMATPRGTNEIERLADLLSPVARQGDVVCARAFQSAVACADAARGSLLWTRNVGGTAGIAGDAQGVLGGDASDRVTAWRAATGEVAWTTEALLHRGLSAPVVAGAMVVFGDESGTLHLLSRDTGKTVLRLSTDGSAVKSLAVAADGTLLAVSRNGGLFAFRF